MFVKYAVSVAILALILPKSADSVTCGCSGSYEDGTDNAADAVLDNFNVIVPGITTPTGTTPPSVKITYPPAGVTSTTTIKYIKVTNLTDGTGQVIVTGGVGSTSATIELPGGSTTRTYTILIKG